MSIEQAIGANIRDLRKKKGLSQARLAELIFSNREHVNHIENGKKLPTVPEVALIALTLDAPCDLIITGSSFMNRTIVDELGLSDTAVNILCARRKNNDCVYLDIINKIIENELFANTIVGFICRTDGSGNLESDAPKFISTEDQESFKIMAQDYTRLAIYECLRYLCDFILYGIDPPDYMKMLAKYGIKTEEAQPNGKA
jgi:transcriptional regulator with XRE-family HTH domain